MECDEIPRALSLVPIIHGKTYCQNCEVYIRTSNLSTHYKSNSHDFMVKFNPVPSPSQSLATTSPMTVPDSVDGSPSLPDEHAGESIDECADTFGHDVGDSASADIESVEPMIPDDPASRYEQYKLGHYSLVVDMRLAMKTLRTVKCLTSRSKIKKSELGKRKTNYQVSFATLSCVIYF